jgi:hypothetical protein
VAAPSLRPRPLTCAWTEAPRQRFGALYAPCPRGDCQRPDGPEPSTDRSPGVVVELGRWEGSDIDFYRGLPTTPTTNGWARFVRIARTRTDSDGRYRFTHVPRYEVVSVLVEGSTPQHYAALGRYEAVWVESIFWLAHTPERREDLPVWDRGR